MKQDMSFRVLAVEETQSINLGKNQHKGKVKCRNWELVF